MHQANAIFDKKLSLYQYHITSALQVRERTKFDEKCAKQKKELEISDKQLRARQIRNTRENL
jgi:hypothetical protein